MQDGKGTAPFPACAKWCHATDLCVAARGVTRGNPSPQETVPQNSFCVRSYFISIMLPPHFLLPVPQHAKDLQQGICLLLSTLWPGVPTNLWPKHSIYPQKGPGGAQTSQVWEGVRAGLSHQHGHRDSQHTPPESLCSGSSGNLLTTTAVPFLGAGAP